MAGEKKFKRKTYFTKLVLVEYPNGIIAGMAAKSDEKPNAAKERKVGSPWKAGRTKNKYIQR